MDNDGYHIISGTSEDRLDSANTFEEALRIARSVAQREGRVEEPILIEHQGMVIWRLILMPDGTLTEEGLA